MCFFFTKIQRNLGATNIAPENITNAYRKKICLPNIKYTSGPQSLTAGHFFYHSYIGTFCETLPTLPGDLLTGAKINCHSYFRPFCEKTTTNTPRRLTATRISGLFAKTPGSNPQVNHKSPSSSQGNFLPPIQILNVAFFILFWRPKDLIAWRDCTGNYIDTNMDI